MGPHGLYKGEEYGLYMGPCGQAGRVMTVYPFSFHFSLLVEGRNRREAMTTKNNRPFSAESRMAWEPEDGGIVNPAGTQFDEDDMVPSAMESELYTKKSQAIAVPAKVGQLQPTNKSLGCWGNFKKGVRCKMCRRRILYDTR